MEGDQKKNRSRNHLHYGRLKEHGRGLTLKRQTPLPNIWQTYSNPSLQKNSPVEEEALIHYLETPYQLDPPLNRLLRSEVRAVVKNINPKKSPGYDLITGKVLEKLPVVGIQYLTQIFNAVILTGHLPAQWKVAQIILILKPGKPPKGSNILPPDKPPTYSVQSFPETTSKPSHPPHCSPKLNTQPSIWLPPTALYHPSNTSQRAQNQRSTSR
jgi:hypothetical protein